MAVENIKEYWDNRYAKQGELTTGFIGHNAEQNRECYQQREQFLWPKVSRYAAQKNILDYGCGVGHYYHIFRPYEYQGELDTKSYTGYDVNEWAIQYCVDYFLSNDNLFNTDFVKEEPSSCEVLFTATVLQHNTDAEVSRILSKYKEAETFLLYEFTGVTNAPHMAQRGINGYEYLVNETTGKFLIEAHSHIVHNQEHTLMIFK